MNDDLSFAYLQYELMRLDMLLHRQLRRMQKLRENSADSALDSFYISAEKAYTLLMRPFGQGTEIMPDEAAAYQTALANIQQQMDDLITHAENQGETIRLYALAQLFGLDRFDLDIFVACIAPAIDIRYEALYGYLHDDLSKKQPSVNTLLDLLCPPGPERLQHLSRFANDAPMFQHRLLRRSGEWGPTLLSQATHPDPSVVFWLLGHYHPQAELESYLTFDPEPLPDLALFQDEQLEALVQATQADVVIALHGADLLCQAVATRFLAAQLGQPLLELDLAAAQLAGFPPTDLIKLLLRDARLIGAVPTLAGWDSVLVEDAPPPRLLEMLCEFPGSVVVSGKTKWQPRYVERARQIFWVEFAVPDYSQRYALLERFLHAAAAADAIDLEGVAGQFALTTGQLRDVINTAKDLAGQNGRVIDNKHLFAAARAHSNPRLATLAKKITPRHRWQDLILPPDQLDILHELLNTVRKRPFVLQEWGLGKRLTASAGITVLFAGPPGTGKTMAAEVLAGEMGLDLYKINLSSVVSKYIGETEKNLEKIFNEAESSNAILFFDEADAIFGKRSEVKDAHDRYANIEVSYLLQRMESYDGVTILATNLRANLDDAFMRRLQFALDFPFPDIKDRRRIWETLFPTSLPREADLDFGRLAESFRLAGGNIRNIIVSAAYLAATNGQKVTMEHLLHGTRRELQKMGRLVDEDLMQ
ncbi:MAG: ATP-binding protein [Chloroflexi bacterium]|nr:ATP-binding protein [Chloroflexota bacterium]